MRTIIPEDKANSIRRLIEHLKVDPHNLEMWFEMERLYDDPAKRREILKGILLMDADNAQAQAALARLDLTPGKAEGGEDRVQAKETGEMENAAGSAALQPFSHRESGVEIPYQVCPFCAEHIRVGAVKCRFCGEYLDGREKPTESKTTPPQTGIRTAALVVLAGCSLVILVVLALLLIQTMTGGSLLPGY